MTDTQTSTDQLARSTVRNTARSAERRSAGLALKLEMLARDAAEAAARVRLGQTYVNTEGLVQAAAAAVRDEAVRATDVSTLIELGESPRLALRSAKAAPLGFTGWMITSSRARGTFLVTGPTVKSLSCSACSNEADNYTVAPVVEKREGELLDLDEAYTMCHGCLSSDFLDDDEQTFTAPVFHGLGRLI